MIISGFLLLLILLLSTTLKVNADCSKQNFCGTDCYMCFKGSVNDFEKVPNVTKFLIIDSIPIDSLSSNLLSRFQNLNGLLIQNCNVSFINKNTFKIHKKLKTLGLSGNSLKKLRTNSFQGLNSLTTLNVGRNKIKCIEHDFFKKTLRKLKTLILWDNELNCFNFKALNHQRDLTMIYMRGNSNFRCQNSFEQYSRKRRIKLDNFQWKNYKIKDTMGPDSECSI